MRTLLILSGNSLKNKAWGEAVAAHYGSQFDTVVEHQYEHWESGAPNIDFARETERLRTVMENFPAGNVVYVFAKSAGSLLTFVATKAGAIAPSYAVFFGIPFAMASEGLFENDWSPVDGFTVPAVAFHNAADPTAAYQPTADVLAARSPHIMLVTTTEEDHWYGDFPTYDEYLVPFLKGEL